MGLPMDYDDYMGLPMGLPMIIIMICPANFEASIFIFRGAVVLGAYHHSKQAGISPNASKHARTRKNEVFSAYLNGHLSIFEL